MSTDIFYNDENGQSLVMLLFFIIIAVSITSASVIMIITNALSATKIQQGTVAYYVAESGAENALLRLLRNPAYTGETLAVNTGSTTTTVTNSSGTYTILSQGTVGGFVRKVQVTASYVNNVFTISSWKEVF